MFCWTKFKQREWEGPFGFHFSSGLFEYNSVYNYDDESLSKSLGENKDQPPTNSQSSYQIGSYLNFVQFFYKNKYKIFYIFFHSLSFHQWFNQWI